MSVQYSNGHGNAGGFRPYDDHEHDRALRDRDRGGLADAGCFLCGESPTYPMVMWSGADGHTIYLHEACAPGFILRLSRDAWELQRVRGDRLIGEDGEYLGA